MVNSRTLRPVGRRESLGFLVDSVEGSRCRRAAFTLIELILVMGLLAVVMALAAPSLSKFFQGRKLESEAQRFVALTRYAQNRAVSDGVPMILWVDRTEGTYGLREQDRYKVETIQAESPWYARKGHGSVETREPDLRLTESLRFELADNGRTNGRIVTIRFLPDGAVDETSLRALLIERENRQSGQAGETQSESIWIAKSVDQSRYEIIDQTNAWERLYGPDQNASGLYVR